MKVRYHVIPSTSGDAWRIKRTGADRATSVHSTQSEAIEEARKLAKKASGGHVVVHGVDGSIRSSRTYKSDVKQAIEQRSS
jgi:hypothetical protein